MIKVGCVFAVVGGGMSISSLLMAEGAAALQLAVTGLATSVTGFALVFAKFVSRR